MPDVDLNFYVYNRELNDFIDICIVYYVVVIGDSDISGKFWFIDKCEEYAAFICNDNDRANIPVRTALELIPEDKMRNVEERLYAELKNMNKD